MCFHVDAKLGLLLLFLSESLTDYFVNDFVLLCNMIHMIGEALQDPETFVRVLGVPGMKGLRRAFSKLGFSSLLCVVISWSRSGYLWFNRSVAGPGH